jgi:probable phosphoglycerate mutase
VKLILVRHGETAANRAGLGLGRADPPLTEHGREQAAALATMVRDRAGEGVAALYTSPLQRANETAAAIGDRIGLAPTRLDALTELDIGAMEGLTAAEMRERHADFLEVWRSERGGDIPMPGGESLAQLQARAWPAIETLRGEHDGATVVAVSHNFAIHAVLCKVLDLPLSQFRQFAIDLASISVVEFRPQRTVVSAINETCHLDGLPPLDLPPPK